MNQKQLDLIRAHALNALSVAPDDVDAKDKLALLAEIDHLRGVIAKRWIPVAERLPELTQRAEGGTGFSDPVLVWIVSYDDPVDSDGSCDVAQYHINNPNCYGNWFTVEYGAILGDITHWQPSPQGPEADNV